MKLLSLALLLRETSADNACEMKCSREHGGRSSALARNCFFGCQFNPDPDTGLVLRERKLYFFQIGIFNNLINRVVDHFKLFAAFAKKVISAC
jgi:hypothetical protein